MKIFQNKSLFNKIVIVLVLILLLSFCIPNTSKAADPAQIGGKLLNPVMSFFVGLSDGVMNLIQRVILKLDTSLIPLNTTTSWIAKIMVIVAAVIVVSVIVLVTVLTAGAAAGGFAIALAVTKGVVMASMVVGATKIAFPLLTTVVEGMLPGTFDLPLYAITPQEIFSNKIPLLDVNFFSTDDNSIELENGNKIQSTATMLKPTISNWYNILRAIALVASLSVLVYIGIRILISSTSKDKAKYKQMLMDWIVAICLLFAMQYIMSFSNFLVERIIEIVDSTKVSIDPNESEEIVQPEMFIITNEVAVEKAYEVLVKNPVEQGQFDSEDKATYYPFFSTVEVDSDGQATAITSGTGSDSNALCWPAENFMQQARIQLQLLKDDTETWVAIGWKLIYVVLVVYTVIFIITYIKRVIYMTFLTLIAPLVALTYPIDKIADGKAQAFDMWLKEYIFNLLIQPMHLIIYTILISSAMDFASDNILYVIVALGFMTQAEKLLRKFFGFSKAETPGVLQGPAGAALIMGGMNKLLGRGSKGGKNSSEKDKSSDSDDGKPPRVNDNFEKDDYLFPDGSPTQSDPTNDGGDDQDDNIIDLNDDEYTIDDVDPSAPLGLSNNNNNDNSDDNTRRSNSNFGLPMNDDSIIDLNDDEYTIENLGPADSNTDANSSTTSTNSSNTNSSTRTVATPDINTDKNSNKPKRSFRRALGQAGRYYARGTANKMANKFKNYNPVRSTAKMASGLAGAAVLGTAGLVAEIASGGKGGGKYLATGMIGGYNLTKGVPDKIASTAPQGTAEAFKQGYYGSDEEYDKVKQQEYIKKYQRDEKKMLELERTYGNKKAKQIMKNDIPDLLNNGVTDMKDITTILDMRENKQIKDINEGIAIKKYASRVGEDTTKMSKKKKDEWRETFTSEFGKKEKYKGMDHEAMTENLFSKLDAYNKIKFK